MGYTINRTGSCFNTNSVCQKDMSRAFAWCFFYLVLMTLVMDGAAGLHWPKHNPDVQAMLRKQQNHQRFVSTTPMNVFFRRTGEHRMQTMPSSRSSPTPRYIDADYLNSLLKSAKNSENVLFVRRDYSHPSPWSSLYNSGNVHTPVKYIQPASSNIRLRTDQFPASYNVVNRSAIHSSVWSTESTTSTTQQRMTAHNVSQTTAKDFYKKMYSTEDGINFLKEEYGATNLSQAKIKHQVDQELEDVRLANEHFLLMRNTIRCRNPAPEVVCVKDVHSEGGKEYLPRCTLLHRCGDRSGCCDSDDFHCVARAVQEVALNFYIVHLDYPPGEIPPENTVEKLLFENHTECECVPISDNPVTTTPTTPSLLKDQHVSSHYHQTTPHPTQNPHQRDANDKEEQEKKEKDEKKKFLKCGHCPRPFHHREYEDGRCSCDCFDKERPCIRIKRGRESLFEAERRCIEMGRCHIPDCEYGMFATNVGRCPKRPDDYDRHAKNGKNPKTLPNENHRWNFFERD